MQDGRDGGPSRVEELGAKGHCFASCAKRDDPTISRSATSRALPSNQIDDPLWCFGAMY